MIGNCAPAARFRSPVTEYTRYALQMSNRHTLTINGRYANIRQLCDFVSAGARAAGLDDDAIFHVELCCDEASTNIIEHGYGGEDLGEITASYEVREGSFCVTLHDHGRAFDPSSVPDPLLSSNENFALDDVVEGLQIGGLGIHLMRSLMDDVQFSFDADHGNVLTLVKNLPTGDEE